MKKIILSFAVLAACIASTHAQNTEKVRKWSLGTSLMPIFDPSAELGIMLKRQLGPGTARLFLSSGTDNKKTATLDNKSEHVDLGLGYQWNKFDGNYSVFYGADILFGNNASSSKTVGTPITVDETKDMAYFGLNVFIGASYRINSRLSIATEIGKRVVGGNTTINNKITNTTTKEETTINQFNLRQLLTINYHF